MSRSSANYFVSEEKLLAIPPALIASDLARVPLSVDDAIVPAKYLPTKVTYFTPEEREQYQVIVHEGKLKKMIQDEKNQVNYKPYYSKKLVLFVVDEKQRIFSAPSAMRIHHSSFTAGKPVAFAGNLKTDKDGNLLEIDNISGHYAPSMGNTLEALDFFSKLGVPIQKTQVYYYAEGCCLFSNRKKLTIKPAVNPLNTSINKTCNPKLN